MEHDIAGRYRLEERIGSGGMAEVWRAIDGRTGATVAVKRLHPGVADDPAARARFRREIEAARAVTHPAAVRVLDAGIDDDAPWLVMEHVAGGSLADQLQSGDRLPLADGALIGSDVAGALSALHAAGIVHRDVTPSNILLPPDGGARLGDFGIARTWDGSALEDVTLTGDLVGTLRFVAPEVLAGEPVAPAADVWALGAVLYEAVTGRRPFDASSPAALLASQRSVPPMDDVDPALAPLLGRMLDPDPAGRPAATAVASALTRIAGHAAAVAGDGIPEEGTVVMATAVPSRAAGAAVEPVAIGAIPPA
jgi:eukaryotic-like serine/threonine-protein kinase